MGRGFRIHWAVPPPRGGPAVERSRHDELASEGIVLGAVQSLPDGGLVMFLADHPTTGGYPVLATVLSADVGAVMARPVGCVVRFALGR